MGKSAYFDITFGAAGDMMLAAFIDLGMPIEHVVSVIRKLPDIKFSMREKRVIKNSISALKLEITMEDEHQHRTLNDITSMINIARKPIDSTLFINMMPISLSVAR